MCCCITIDSRTWDKYLLCHRVSDSQEFGWALLGGSGPGDLLRLQSSYDQGCSAAGELAWPKGFTWSSFTWLLTEEAHGLLHRAAPTLILPEGVKGEQGRERKWAREIDWLHCLLWPSLLVIYHHFHPVIHSKQVTNANPYSRGGRHTDAWTPGGSGHWDHLGAGYHIYLTAHNLYNCI